ncbi:MAG: carbonic anhydrase [bacterium]
MSRSKFATVINCMDGRTQLQVNDWLRSRCGVDHVDTITEPGPVCLLAGGNAPAIESIRNRVAISVERHGSRTVAVVAHHDCAGNPKPRTLQVQQLKRSVERVRSWQPAVEVVGLWVGRDWQVKQVVASGSPA